MHQALHKVELEVGTFGNHYFFTFRNVYIAHLLSVNGFLLAVAKQ
jgi:hypothetical protein